MAEWSKSSPLTGAVEHIFETTIPWYEIVMRGAIVYVALLVLLRLSGKRTVGQFTPFDLLVLVLLGDAVQGAMIDEDKSVTGGILLVVTLLALNWIAGFLSARSRKVDEMLEGSPVLLMRDGILFESVLKRSNISHTDLKESMRKAGCVRMEDVRLAVLETNGQITVVPVEPHQVPPPDGHRAA